MDTQATIEYMMGTMFSIRYAQSGYTKEFNLEFAVTVN
jgi:hypothetical protein